MWHRRSMKRSSLQEKKKKVSWCQRTEGVWQPSLWCSFLLSYSEDRLRMNYSVNKCLVFSVTPPLSGILPCPHPLHLSACLNGSIHAAGNLCVWGRRFTQSLPFSYSENLRFKYVCDLSGPKLQLKNHERLKGWTWTREILKGIISTGG